MPGPASLEEPRYDRIRVAIGDGDAAVATGLKEALHERGIVEVILCETTERLYRALDDEIVDLVLYDYHMLGDQFVEVMQRIRRKEVGQNPFVTIVATIRESTAETVRRLIDAGVDDLIRMPASIDRVFESIANSARRRRPFVITYEYVGPQRPVRNARKRIAEPTPGIRVPNTLKSRAFDGVSEESVRALVEAAVKKMVDQQLASCGNEIGNLAKRVAETYASIDGSERNQQMRGSLNRMAVVANDLRSKATGTSSESVSDLAATLIPITQRILDAPAGRALIEVQLLSQLAAAVRCALQIEGEAEPAIHQITETVGDFTRRHAPDPAHPHHHH